jgi:hypothetical protein
LKLAKNFNGKVLSPASLAQRLQLSIESQNALKAEMSPALYNERFKLITEELNKLIAFKTVELDNGAYLSAETKNFDTVFQKEQVQEGKTSFSTIGKIIDERVRKQK